MKEQEEVPKKKFKVTHPLLAWRTSGEGEDARRSFERHEIGEHVHMTEEEAKAFPPNHLEPVEEEAEN